MMTTTLQNDQINVLIDGQNGVGAASLASSAPAKRKLHLHLLALPAELISKVLGFAYVDMLDPKNDYKARAAFKTGVAVEGTCRLLREISFGVPLFPDGDWSYPQMERLVPVHRKARTMRATEVFFINEPRRFKDVQGLDFGRRCLAAASAKLIEAAREIKAPKRQDGCIDLAALPQIRSFMFTPCHIALVKPLSQGWAVKYLYLGYEYNVITEMSPEQLQAVVSACASDLLSFKMVLAGSTDRTWAEPAIKAALAGLKEGCKKLGELNIEQLLAPCSQKTTVSYLAAFKKLI